MNPRARLSLVLLSVVVGQTPLHGWTVSRSAIVESTMLLGAPTGEQCSYALSPTSVSLPSTGTASAQVSVVTGTSCSWTAASNASWITVTNGAGGTGFGWVNYSVAANTTGAARTGTMTIAGIAFTVSQGGNSCSYNLSATSASYPATGTASGALSVVTGTSCSWTAVSQAAWITVTGGASGTGIGAVAYTVAANPGTQRVGTMLIAGVTFTVTQAGGSTTLAPPTGLRALDPLPGAALTAGPTRQQPEKR
jgi:hypothetical protein